MVARRDRADRRFDGAGSISVVGIGARERPRNGVGAGRGRGRVAKADAAAEIDAVEPRRREGGEVCLAVEGEIVGRDRDRGGALLDRVDDDRGGIFVESRAKPVPAGVAAVGAEVEAVDHGSRGESEVGDVERDFGPRTRLGETVDVRGGHPGRNDDFISPRGCGPSARGTVVEAERERSGGIVRIQPDMGCDQAIGRNRERLGSERVVAGINKPGVADAVVVLQAGVGVDLVEALRAGVGGVARPRVGILPRIGKEGVVEPDRRLAEHDVGVVEVRAEEPPVVGVFAGVDMGGAVENQTGGKILAVDAGGGAGGHVRKSVVGDLVGRDDNRGGGLRHGADGRRRDEHVVVGQRTGQREAGHGHRLAVAGVGRGIRAADGADLERRRRVADRPIDQGRQARVERGGRRAVVGA